MTITTITNRGQHTTELPSIDCRGGPDAAAGEVRRYILEQRAPVKLTGLAEGWLPLPTPWSDLSALKKAFPDIPVTVGYAPCAAGAHGAGALASFDGINPANGDVEFAALAGVGLADAVEAIMAEHRALEDLSPLTERIYIAESYRTELAALLMQALPLPAWWRDSGGGDFHFSQPFFGPEGVDLPAHGASSKSLVWMSAGGTVAAPHRDLHHNFHVSLAGSKVFHLVHPDQHKAVGDHSRPATRLKRVAAGVYRAAPRLDQFGDPVHTAGYSPVDFASPNLDAHPAFAAVGVLHCTLEPGDVLFMPHDWSVVPVGVPAWQSNQA